MSEMIERVAGKFAAELMELTADERKSFVFPDDCNGDTIDRARSVARALIHAMREPTEAMLWAWNISTIDDRYDVLTGWHLMIDEALRHA